MESRRIERRYCNCYARINNNLFGFGYKLSWMYKNWNSIINSKYYTYCKCFGFLSNNMCGTIDNFNWYWRYELYLDARIINRKCGNSFSRF
jgi:hypothetical protein